jgi:23S rRNA (pseudouridine1915-N3)-methyltransferase
VGPADGWGAEVWGRASPRPDDGSRLLSISLGRITMAHEIARVVLLEQIYRACTILAGHPYHRGH